MKIKEYISEDTDLIESVANVDFSNNDIISQVL